MSSYNILDCNCTVCIPVIDSFFVCSIILPFIAYRALYTVLPHGIDNGTATQEDIATFGFLLGTFPTAPTVFVFASQYSLAMEIVSAIK